jgi:glutamine cyclotransferase
MTSRAATFCALVVLLAATAVGGDATAPAYAAESAAQRAERLRVEVLATYPHDTAAFTQGLELHDGLLYEGTGLTGQSELRIVEPETGDVRDRVALPDTVFGEGITVVGERIWQLTYLSEFAFLRDRSTLTEVGRVEYAGQGWGLCHDPFRERLVMSSGAAELTFRDPETFAPLSSVPVTLDGEPLRNINELECVGDKVWANVWLTDQIVRIDPGTGIVEAVVDASGLLTESERQQADVLNGIAATPEAGVFLITGKLWPKLFRVRFAAAARSETPQRKTPY